MNSIPTSTARANALEIAIQHTGHWGARDWTWEHFHAGEHKLTHEPTGEIWLVDAVVRECRPGNAIARMTEGAAAEFNAAP